MRPDKIEKSFDEHKSDVLIWHADCHDCNTEVNFRAERKKDGIHLSGGAMYEPIDDEFFFKCPECFKNNPTLTRWQKNEIYSRCVGYMRPISSWNKGKQSEFKKRVPYKII